MIHSLLPFTWTFIFSTISSASILIPASLSIILFKRQAPPLKYLSILLFIGVFVELFARILLSYKASNLPLLHLYIPIEFALLGWMYQLYLHRLYPRYIIPLIIVIFTLFSVVNSVFIQSIKTFNTNARAVENLLLIIFAVSYFYKLLKELKIRYLEKNPMFWINTGILIYFSGSLFLFIFSNYSIIDKSISRLTWIIHAFLNIFINIIYSIGLWLSRGNSE